MRFSKSLIYKMIIGVIIILSYIALSIIVIPSKTTVFWQGMVFTILSVILFVVAMGNTLYRESSAKEYNLNMPGMSIATGYLILQSTLGILFPLVFHNNIVFPLVIMILLFAASACLVFGALIQKERVIVSDAAAEASGEFTRCISARLKTLYDNEIDAKRKAELKTLYEIARFGKPGVNADAAPLEAAIKEAVCVLEKEPVVDGTTFGETAHKMKTLLRQRDNVL